MRGLKSSPLFGPFATSCAPWLTPTWLFRFSKMLRRTSTRQFGVSGVRWLNATCHFPRADEPSRSPTQQFGVSGARWLNATCHFPRPDEPCLSPTRQFGVSGVRWLNATCLFPRPAEPGLNPPRHFGGSARARRRSRGLSWRREKAASGSKVGFLAPVHGGLGRWLAVRDRFPRHDRDARRGPGRTPHLRPRPRPHREREPHARDLGRACSALRAECGLIGGFHRPPNRVRRDALFGRSSISA